MSGILGPARCSGEAEEVRRIIFVLELYARGWELYSNRLDKDWGVSDCISFVIMQDAILAKPSRATTTSSKQVSRILL